MSKRRVVITGIGVVTPLGTTAQATLDALASGRSAIGPATLFDASGFRCALAAEIKEWDPRPSFRTPKALKLTDRPARFAVGAAQLALADAAWPQDEAAREALGVVIGSSGSDLQARDIGAALANDEAGDTVADISRFADRMLSGLNPLWLLINLPNMTSAHVAIQIQARGPNSTIMSDWAAGHQAVGEAAEWIRAGEADAVLAGGADGGVQPFAYAAYQQALLFGNGVATTFVPGEGAAVFLLEERNAALRRGATIHAEVSGYAAQSGEVGAAIASTLCEAMTTAGWHRDNVSRSVVAAPPLPAFEGPASDAIASMLGDVPARTCFEPRLGYPLAAAAPIDAALLLHSSYRGRLLSTAVGLSGEAVTLALDRH